MRDSKNMTSVCDDPAEISTGQRRAAQRTVAAFAVDASDAAELMLILGIHPLQIDEGMSVAPTTITPCV